jgi:hypothetical protein
MEEETKDEEEPPPLDPTADPGSISAHPISSFPISGDLPSGSGPTSGPYILMPQIVT